jgi:hypothetical protein
MPHHLFDEVTGKTIVEINILLRLLIISINQSEELHYFEVLNLYYLNTVNRQINLNLTYRKLSYISKKLVKKLIKKSINIILKRINAYKYADERCDECIAEQIKVKLFPLK